MQDPPACMLREGVPKRGAGPKTVSDAQAKLEDILCRVHRGRRGRRRVKAGRVPIN